MNLLRQSDLLEFIEHLPVAVFRSTPSGRLVTANSSLVDLLGYDSVDDLMSVSVSDLYTDPALRGRLVTRLEDGEEIAPHEVELRRKDGSTIWVRVTARTVEDDRGDPLCMEGVLEDVTERHEVEAALEASEARFSSAFRNAPQGLAIMGSDLVPEQVNDALANMLGVNKTELLIGSAARFIHPDELADAMGLMAEVRAGVVDSYKVERRLRHADGRYVHTLIATSAVRAPDGTLDAILSQVFDITDRVEAQRDLAESEALFRSTFDDAPTGMVIAEDGLRVSRANPAMCRLLGTSESALEGLALTDLWTCEDTDPQSLEHLGAVESTQLLGERRLSLIDQRDVWALVSISSVTGPGRRRDPILAQFVDVSEHHHAVDALRRSEAKNSALLDAIPDTMMRIGRDGEVKGFRPAAASTPSFLQAPPNLGSVGELFPDHVGPLLEQVTEVLETGKASQLDLGLTETGPERHFTATISQIDDADALVTLRDVTEERMLRQQLESLINSKDEVVASVSHELRTPLTAVVGLATELRREPASFEPGERDELIGLIADQSREMAELIDDLLVAARSERGQVVVAPRLIDIAVEVGHVLEVWTEGTAQVNLSAAAKAHADPFRVRQILRNLLSNAARYGIPPIRISAEPTNDGYVELLVEDHGPGLSPDQWEAIFDPYHRAFDREVPSASVGLGLAVSRHLAEAMGGSLDYLVQNERSTFRLRLPAVAPE